MQEKLMQIDDTQYFLDPQDSAAIESIELAVGRPMPENLRRILQKIGFLQNAITDWPESSKEFISMLECIPSPYYAVMGDGAGNYFILGQTEKLLFWDHETEQSSPSGDTLEKFIQGNLRPPENLGSLAWHIQLSLNSITDTSALAFYKDLLQVETTGPWLDKGTSPADVHCYEAEWTSPSLKGTVSKSTYNGWPKNMYSIDLTISIQDIYSWKSKLTSLERSESDFKVISYGLMPKDLLPSI